MVNRLIRELNNVCILFNGISPILILCFNSDGFLYTGQHSKKKHRNRFVRTNFYHFIFLSCFQLAEYWGNSCSFILTAFKEEYKWASGLDNFILIRLLFSSVCYLLRFEDIRADTAAGKYGV